MIKKRFITIAAFVALLAIPVIGLATFYQSDNKSNLSTTISTTTDEELPSWSELKEKHGNNISKIDKVLVSTVIYQDINKAILTTKSNEEIKVPVVVTSKEDKEFTLSSVKYAPQHLKIGDSFGLAKLESQYFAYKCE